MEVDEVEPLIHYMTSTPMNARDYLKGDNLKAFRAYLNKKISEGSGSIHITMESGFFDPERMFTTENSRTMTVGRGLKTDVLTVL